MRLYEPIWFRVRDDPITYCGYFYHDGLILDRKFNLVDDVVFVISRWEGALAKLPGIAILAGSGYLMGRAIWFLWQLVSGI